MKLSEILTITGQSGLHRFIGQNKIGVIVETLTDARRFLVPSASKVSALSDIAVFAYTEDFPLFKIFQEIYTATGGQQVKDPKGMTNDEIKAQMRGFIAEYDDERVHLSDMKKLFTWYNILIVAGATCFEDESLEEGGDDENKLEVKPKIAAPKIKAKAPNIKTQANTKSKSASKVRTIKAS